MDFKERFILLKAKIIGFFQAKGVYVVLFLCLSAIGAAAAIAFLPSEDAENADIVPPASEVDISSDDRLAAMFSPTPTVLPSASASAAPTPTPSPMPEFTKAPEATKTPVTQELLIAPLKGAVIWDYAMSELIYSETLDQWTTHSGVDIRSPKGSEVYCVMSGTVEKVFTDDSLGECVLISHADDVFTLYANLKSEPPVREGQKVNSRTVIGYVGDTAICECGTESHLHFEYRVGSKCVDPKTKVLFDKTT